MWVCVQYLLTFPGKNVLQGQRSAEKSLGNADPARNQRPLILSLRHHLLGGMILSFYLVG